MDSAGRQWSGNLMTLRGALMCMVHLWPHVLRLSGKKQHVECPVEFSGQEIREMMENEPVWCNLNAVVGRWRDELGVLSEEGWVPAEKYDAAVERNGSLRAEIADGASLDELEGIRRGWPFRDHEEFF